MITEGWLQLKKKEKKRKGGGGLLQQWKMNGWLMKMESLRKKPRWENPQTLRLSSVTVIFTSNSHVPTLTTQSAKYSKLSNFHLAGAEAQADQQQLLLPSAPLHLPQENWECLSPKTPAAKTGHRAGQGNHRLLKPTCPKLCLASPSLQLLFEGLQFPRRP